MKKVLALLALLPSLALAQPVVELDTNQGNIEISLDQAHAPKTVANFLAYVKSGHYNGTVFHRVIEGFMIQGGGFDAKLKERPTRAPIANEAANGLKNTVGTIAMARTPEPDSATSQFFINVANNDPLDFRDKSPEGIGYAVFGKVTRGMDVVMRISRMKTVDVGMMSDVPSTPVIILKASIKG
ncbi:peptidylprolyl isomerase [Paludibacterium purpuratum]|uniref:Peptidyl-prolyl cis-trans isomerase n=1 Tax=Paludibacterium purpuratum TaxID=1144873 RepID=A0A4R7BBA7_9NEIS|nr:peptidylprolyl isomerase [Paludibacterium purpuratum]TDR82244.1 peptidylprolyl isomerase/peptidyl-prolyl cis-trans isomerase A (cyclophilin A)/peptidyl-prolyl cis-trans isomerase B (cyclophilin B) [Paludibacterium purpuratum]